MLELWHDLEKWAAQGQSIALTTVIETWGSSPRAVGAKMAVTLDGGMTGSVSGGCVEGAVVEASLQTLKKGTPQLLHFGVADETAWEVGLACGGSMEVFVRPLQAQTLQAMQQSIAEEQALAVITVIAGPPDQLGREAAVLEDGRVFGKLDLDVQALARESIQHGAPRRVKMGALELFVDVILPPLTLILVGGVHIAIALAQIARTLGYRTIVVDPRRQFGSPERFPHADQLIQLWTDEALTQIGLNGSTAVAMLTHDPKLDDPGLLVALPSRAFYVGALGSNKTQTARRERLLAAGLTQAQLDRLHGPIGLDLGGRSPEEIALAIMAEIVQARYR